MPYIYDKETGKQLVIIVTDWIAYEFCERSGRVISEARLIYSEEYKRPPLREGTPLPPGVPKPQPRPKPGEFLNDGYPPPLPFNTGCAEDALIRAGVVPADIWYRQYEKVEVRKIKYFFGHRIGSDPFKRSIF